ncbi:uncharacterized protein [Drosophila pseudoobscura]|uniref:Uncharacterized protein n=1 Tax=Drosophila pseudoobscura pseudoobscura TaxID=46245 RepID=A0A6I8VMS2_DROPS|nr:uncharacterized protein LOC117183238 [Drosophila pseudoobscura]
MLLKFKEAFEQLIEKVPGRKELNFQDVEEIVQKISQAFHGMNSVFQGSLMNLKETCINRPGHQVLLRLKMPFKITPNGTFIYQTGETLYSLNANIRHPAVQNGFFIPQLIQSLFNIDLKRAIASIGEFNSETGKTYTLSVTDEQSMSISRFKIKANPSGINSQALHFLFTLGFTFLDDSKIYMVDPECPFLFGATDDDIVRGATKHTAKVIKLLGHLNVDEVEVHGATYMAFNTLFSNSCVIGLTFEALKILISVFHNADRLTFVYNKLMNFKQLDSVDPEELMALFLPG